MPTIIKLTELHYKSIDPTQTGWSNLRLIKTNTKLFNISQMISAEPQENGITKITFKCALVDRFYCRESLEEIEKLIKA